MQTQPTERTLPRQQSVERLSTESKRPGTGHTPESEFPAGRKEGELVVRLAESHRQHPHAAPEHFVGEVLVQKEEIVEVVLRNDEEPAPLMGPSIGRARTLVEERHFSEHLSRTEHGERLFPHPRYLSRDADLPLEDDEELVPGIPVLEDTRAGSVSLFDRHLGDEGQRFAAEPVEE